MEKRQKRKKKKAKKEKLEVMDLQKSQAIRYFLILWLLLAAFLLVYRFYNMLKDSNVDYSYFKLPLAAFFLWIIAVFIVDIYGIFSKDSLLAEGFFKEKLNFQSILLSIAAYIVAFFVFIILPILWVYKISVVDTFIFIISTVFLIIYKVAFISIPSIIFGEDTELIKIKMLGSAQAYTLDLSQMEPQTSSLIFVFVSVLSILFVFAHLNSFSSLLKSLIK